MTDVTFILVLNLGLTLFNFKGSWSILADFELFDLLSDLLFDLLFDLLDLSSDFINNFLSLFFKN